MSASSAETYARVKSPLTSLYTGRWVQPRARFASISRSIGDRAVKAIAARWRMSSILWSNAPINDVHIGHGASRSGPNM